MTETPNTPPSKAVCPECGGKKEKYFVGNDNKFKLEPCPSCTGKPAVTNDRPKRPQRMFRGEMCDRSISDLSNDEKADFIVALESYADQEHARAERLMGENAELKDQLSDALKGRAGI